jgi:hypothetical protein
MPTWGVVVVTIVISLLSAYGFLMLRCRRTGNPFGHRARWWAITVIAITAAVSTGAGLVVLAAGDHVIAAAAGLVLPSGLWLGKAARRYGDRVPRGLIALVTFPLRRLDDAMGEDMQQWCDTRLRAASRTPQYVSDAAEYYYNQVGGQVRDDPVHNQLVRWRDSIRHKVGVVRLIEAEEGLALVEEALRDHPATTDPRKYPVDDLARLARRLMAEAENELFLFLACVYRLGFHRLLIYPFRPEAEPRVMRAPGGQATGREPTADQA